jgi:hypothetical protein
VLEVRAETHAETQKLPRGSDRRRQPHLRERDPRGTTCGARNRFQPRGSTGEQRHEIVRKAIVGTTHIGDLLPVDEADPWPGVIDKRHQFHDTRFNRRLAGLALRSPDISHLNPVAP